MEMGLKGTEGDKPTITREQAATVLELARRHAAQLKELKEAIESGNRNLEHELARKLVGLPEGESTQ
jgi:hypothetical protein